MPKTRAKLKREKELLAVAIRNFCEHSSDGISQEQRDAEYAVVEKEWEDAAAHPDTFAAWQEERNIRMGLEWQETVADLKKELGISELK
jgi:hypothetical protein